MPTSARRRSWFVWGVAVAAYAVAIFQRTSLGVAAGPATERFGVGASVLSTFVVLQLVVYAAMQIPVGILVDRFGSRLLLVAGALLMAVGQTTMALATHPGTAVLARVVVGAGDAMTFISVLRIIPAWFPARRVPMVTQLTGQVGQLGQVASTIPLAAALAGPGWTPAYLGAAAVGVLAALLVLLAVRDRPVGSPAAAPVGWAEAMTDLRSSFVHPGTRLGLWSHFSTQFSGMVFVLLWGYPFMTAGLGYSPGLAGGLLTLMVLAGPVIGPVLGQLTAQYPLRRSNLIFGVMITTVATWTLVLLWPGTVPLPLLVLLLVVLAAYGPASAVGFDFARSFNPSTRLGAASGIVNMGGFTASLITIFAIGVILDWRAPTGAFDLADFEIAFCFQYVLWAFGFVSLWSSRRLTRAGMRADGGAPIDPLARAIARRWRHRPRR
ncbi:Nitrate/nitrite transporter NarK [Friedmanniella luteola]|uniref:Lysosomal dipeptide transporter MFSD1 n=1 Tax=Friedmanniella luteola TaxID=546871 RepID=A0A1H1QL89_9ACTN|nr:MFS transporter [Friedmanniella luteola]SDS24232.1 Nitrate/nitrite transporter NarK [Friedmanniella luteola]